LAVRLPQRRSTVLAVGWLVGHGVCEGGVGVYEGWRWGVGGRGSGWEGEWVGGGVGGEDDAVGRSWVRWIRPAEGGESVMMRELLEEQRRDRELP
jgi:hypothetical protein